MDDKLFKQKLTEVAEWRIPDTVTGTASGDAKAPRKRGRPTAEEAYQEAHEEIFLEIFDGKNPTFPPQILKLKNSAVTCDDCGKHCAEGRLKEIKRYVSNNKVNWREHCMACHRWRDPYTGEFKLVNSNVSTVWNSFVRDTKNKYKSKGNIAKEDQGIIRSYPETKDPL